MRIVIQRCAQASVTLNNEVKTAIGRGYLILLGIEESDTEEDANWLIHKVINLRVFDDEQGIMNRSIMDIDGEILVVKARKADTKEPVYLAFQSLPDGPDRKNVTIYWRELTNGTISVNDFVSASAWNSRSYLVQTGDSAYSTMDVQRDGGIGFVYPRTALARSV